MICRDDLAVLIVRFLEQKIFVDPAATTTYDELAIVLVSPLKRCASDITEAAALVDAACFVAGVPLLGTFRVRRVGGSIDVSALPAPAWRERYAELQRRDQLHRWDRADFSAVREELGRLSGRSAKQAWDETLRTHNGSALARALRAGRPSLAPDSVLLVGSRAAPKPAPLGRSWRF